eukprot:COSAG06_NODE_10908_length_1598_cov_1.166111_2_plen_156_part_00
MSARPTVSTQVSMCIHMCFRLECVCVCGGEGECCVSLTRIQYNCRFSTVFRYADSCVNCLVEDCHIDVGDDGVSIKAYDVVGVGPAPCSNVTIRRTNVISRNICVGGATEVRKLSKRCPPFLSKRIIVFPRQARANVGSCFNTRKHYRLSTGWCE